MFSVDVSVHLHLPRDGAELPAASRSDVLDLNELISTLQRIFAPQLFALQVVDIYITVQYARVGSNSFML